MSPRKIPIGFFIRFGLKNYLLAFFTGLLAGYFLGALFPWLIPPISALVGGATALIIYPFIEYSYFSGNRRGEFEYIYLQSLIDSRIKGVIRELPFRFLLLEKYASYGPTNVIPLLLKKIETETNPDRKFELYMAVAWSAAGEDQHQKVIEYLQQSLVFKKNNLVASFRLGESWERLGKGVEAIQAYEMALQDPSLDSPPLREFVMAQIDRIKTKGPQKGIPYPYFKYIWG